MSRTLGLGTVERKDARHRDSELRGQDQKDVTSLPAFRSHRLIQLSSGCFLGLRLLVAHILV